MTFTIPNLLTLLRMGMVPWFIISLVNGRPGQALLVFSAAGITDALDGWGRDGDDVQEVVMEALAVLLDDSIHADEVDLISADQISRMALLWTQNTEAPMRRPTRFAGAMPIGVWRSPSRRAAASARGRTPAGPTWPRASTCRTTRPASSTGRTKARPTPRSGR